jgi:hypothetical protein
MSDVRTTVVDVPRIDERNADVPDAPSGQARRLARLLPILVRNALRRARRARHKYLACARFDARQQYVSRQQQARDERSLPVWRRRRQRLAVGAERGRRVFARKRDGRCLALIKRVLGRALDLAVDEAGHALDAILA